MASSLEVPHREVSRMPMGLATPGVFSETQYRRLEIRVNNLVRLHDTAGLITLIKEESEALVLRNRSVTASSFGIEGVPPAEIECQKKIFALFNRQLFLIERRILDQRVLHRVRDAQLSIISGKITLENLSDKVILKRADLKALHYIHEVSSHALTAKMQEKDSAFKRLKASYNGFFGSFSLTYLFKYLALCFEYSSCRNNHDIFDIKNLIAKSNLLQSQMQGILIS